MVNYKTGRLPPTLVDPKIKIIRVTKTYLIAQGATIAKARRLARKTFITTDSTLQGDNLLFALQYFQNVDLKVNKHQIN